MHCQCFTTYWFTSKAVRKRASIQNKSGKISVLQSGCVHKKHRRPACEVEQEIWLWRDQGYRNSWVSSWCAWKNQTAGFLPISETSDVVEWSRLWTVDLLGTVFQKSSDKTIAHGKNYTADFQAESEPYDKENHIVRYCFSRCPIAESAEKYNGEIRNSRA